MNIVDSLKEIYKEVYNNSLITSNKSQMFSEKTTCIIINTPHKITNNNTNNTDNKFKSNKESLSKTFNISSNNKNNSNNNWNIRISNNSRNNKIMPSNNNLEHLSEDNIKNKHIDKRIIHRVLEEKISHVTGNFRASSKPEKSNYSYTSNNTSFDSNPSKKANALKKLMKPPVKKNVEIYVNKKKAINLMDNNEDSSSFISSVDNSNSKTDVFSTKGIIQVKSPPLIIKESKNILSSKQISVKDKVVSKVIISHKNNSNHTTNNYNNLSNNKSNNDHNDHFNDLKKGPIVKKQNLSYQLKIYDQNNNGNSSLKKHNDNQNDFSFAKDCGETIKHEKDSDNSVNIFVSTRESDQIKLNLD